MIVYDWEILRKFNILKYRYLMDLVFMCIGVIFFKRNLIIFKKGFVGCLGLFNFLVILR